MNEWYIVPTLDQINKDEFVQYLLNKQNTSLIYVKNEHYIFRPHKRHCNPSLYKIVIINENNLSLIPYRQIKNIIFIELNDNIKKLLYDKINSRDIGVFGTDFIYKQLFYRILDIDEFKDTLFNAKHRNTRYLSYINPILLNSIGKDKYIDMIVEYSLRDKSLYLFLSRIKILDKLDKQKIYDKLIEQNISYIQYKHDQTAEQQELALNKKIGYIQYILHPQINMDKYYNMFTLEKSDKFNRYIGHNYYHIYKDMKKNKNAKFMRYIDKYYIAVFELFYLLKIKI